MMRWPLVLLAACSPGDAITQVTGGCDGAAAVSTSFDRLDVDTDHCFGTARLCNGGDCTPTVSGGNPPGDECDGTQSAYCASTHTLFVWTSIELSIIAFNGGPAAGTRASFVCAEGFEPAVSPSQVTLFEEHDQCTSALTVRAD